MPPHLPPPNHRRCTPDKPTCGCHGLGGSPGGGGPGNKAHAKALCRSLAGGGQVNAHRW